MQYVHKSGACPARGNPLQVGDCRGHGRVGKRVGKSLVMGGMALGVAVGLSTVLTTTQLP